ncbi:MAG: lytic murein transglycosylase, partial [Solirubrobacterales bacterium]|nr:lytic murein transglycosylase [Solirubrobacterales bacterium]
EPPVRAPALVPARAPAGSRRARANLRWVRGAVLSLLAGGGLGAAGVGGPLAGELAAAASAPGGSSTPESTSSSAAETTSGSSSSSSGSDTSTETSETSTTTTSQSSGGGSSSTSSTTTTSTTGSAPASGESSPPGSGSAPGSQGSPGSPASTTTGSTTSETSSAAQEGQGSQRPRRHSRGQTPSRHHGGAPAPSRHAHSRTESGKHGGAKGGHAKAHPTRPAAHPGAGAGRHGASKAAPSPQAVANEVASSPQMVAARAAMLEGVLSSAGASVQSLSFYRIPLFLLPIYQSAAVQYGVPWQVLAAINEVETDYGSDLSVSTAGAVGWMQFMPSTWLQYGVDVLNAGYADPYNPVDAIFAAARYLSAAGAAKNLRGAIFAYNHSQEYVESVLLRAKLIADYPKLVVATLTGLTEGVPPVAGAQVVPGSVPPGAFPVSNPSSSSSSTANSLLQSVAPAPNPTSPAPSPGAAVKASAAGARGGAAHAAHAAPRPLVELAAPSQGAVVAVQDGRVVALGSSRALGRYVVLRDVYGDLFTYAGLGDIAPRYWRGPPGSRGGQAPRAALLGVSSSRDRRPSAAASAGTQPPVTLHVTPSPAPRARPRTVTPAKSAPAHPATVARAAAPAPAPTPARAGGLAGGLAIEHKMSFYAHPDNPYALTASARARSHRAHRRAPETGWLALQVGSVVSQGTTLGHLAGAPAGQPAHMRFAIRPAGDAGTIDPRPLLQSWTALYAATHPRGARGGSALIGATAEGVFLLSADELRGEVLSDPGIGLDACGRADVAAGAVDRRVLAALAFLSRSGLKPTVAGLACPAEPSHGARTSTSTTGRRRASAVQITHVNGIPVAGHQGAGAIADLT